VTVVLDTNVIVAALVAEGLCREVVHRAVRLRVLASSDGLLNELENTLRRKFTLTPAAAAFLKAFRQQIRIVDPEPLSKPACRDRDDDLVLATAVAASANFIVTGDNDLLVLQRYQRIAIVTPRSFLERLDAVG
jgi:putative PIN family toxin of toxin-antitoxin system